MFCPIEHSKHRLNKIKYIKLKTEVILICIYKNTILVITKIREIFFSLVMWLNNRISINDVDGMSAAKTD